MVRDSTYLPRTEWLHLEGGETAEPGHVAEPLLLGQRDGVEDKAVGEDDHQVDEPHAAQHGQDPVEHVHHSPVLREESGPDPWSAW